MAGLHFGPLLHEKLPADFGNFKPIASTYGLRSILRFEKKSDSRNSNKVRSKLEKNAISHFLVCEKAKIEYSKSRGLNNGLMLKFSLGGAVTVRDRPHKVYEVE